MNIKKIIIYNFLFYCFALFLLVSCGGGGDAVNGDLDTTPPSVISTGPHVSAIFSEAMTSSDFTTTTITVSDEADSISGTVEYNGTTVTFTPDINLTPGIIYKATISRTVTDLAGNPLESDYSWYFKTSSVNGKDWLLPTDLGSNLTWYQVNDVCDKDTGNCSGFINEIEVSGYIWASQLDLAEMMDVFTKRGITSPSYHVQEVDSIWAPAFLDIFSPTEDLEFRKGIFGWIREESDLDPVSSAWYGALHDSTDSQELDIASVGGGSFPKSSTFSAWLYQPAPSSF